MCIIFLSVDRCYMILPCYLHTIYIFCFIYRLWRWYFWIYFNLHIQGSKFGENFYKFGRKSFKKTELHGVHGVRFFQVCTYISLQYIHITAVHTYHCSTYPSMQYIHFITVHTYHYSSYHCRIIKLYYWFRSYGAVKRGAVMGWS